MQWLRPYLKYPMGDLEPLSKILKGNNNPNSSRQFTEDARQIPTRAEYAIQKQVRSALASMFITHKTYPTTVSPVRILNS